MDIYSDFKLPRHVTPQDHGKKSISGGHHPGRGRPTNSGSNGNVLGRFLKLGKSKSDANGYGNKSSRSRPASYPHDDCEDDFRITSSRSAVERMVHKVNSRKEVSRSHSWIYGSVKLSSDLPFGYGCGFSPGSTSSSTNSPNSSTQHSSSRPCQKSEFCGSCDCTNDFDFLRPEPSSHPYPPIQDGFSYCSAHGHQPAPPGHFQMHSHHPGLPYHYLQENGVGGTKSKSSSSSHRHKGHADFANPSTNSALEPTSKFVSSVRKLTWKSLKQAVKKRPSLDNVLKSKSSSNNPPLQFSPVHSPPPMHDDPAFGANTSYFFPDKKNYYASCTDLYGENPPYVTASVRVRPKRPRQPWPFPNEFGPVPNYQEEEIYHSEWDLRQFMPYDVWLNATSNNPCLQPIPSDPNSVTKLPKISRSASGPLQILPDISKGHSTFDKHPQKQPVPTRSSSTNKSSPSVASSINGSVNSRKGTPKRSSILDPDVTAYQLIKPNGKNAASPTTKIEQSDSDELSDNALNDDPVRIGGQGIYMPLNQAAASTSASSTPTVSSGSNPKSSLNSTGSAQSSAYSGFLPDAPDPMKHQAAHHSNCRLKPDEELCQSIKIKPDNVRITRNQQPLKKQESRALERGKHPPAFHKPNNHTAIDFQDRSLAATKSLKTYFSQPPPPSPSTSDAHSIYQAAVFNTGHFTNETLSPKYSTDSTFTDESSYDNHASYTAKQDKDSQTAQSASTEDTTTNRVKFSTDSKDDESFDSSRYAPETSAASAVNRYGALKKRKNRNSSSTASNSSPHGKVLFKETIYEEDSENSDDNKTTYAVKIIVSQNTSSEYVKPILKKERPPVAIDESNLQHSSYSEPDSVNSQTSNSSPSSATSSPYNTQQKPGPRSTKKVQFNHKQTIVCQGLSEDEVDDGEESDDTLVREPDLQNEWITVEELGAQTVELLHQASPPSSNPPIVNNPSDLDKYRDSSVIKHAAPTQHHKNKIHITQVNNPQVTESHTTISNSLSHNRNNPSLKQDTPPIPPSHPSPPQKREQQHQHPPKAEPVKNPPPRTHSTSSQQSNANYRTNSTTSPKSIQLPASIKHDSSSRTAPPVKNLPVSGSARIINPNSLLFHDTTRIRLNQTRPSLENSFKLNISGQRQDKRANNPNSTGTTSTFAPQSKSSTKIKQSSSFRHPIANITHHIVPAPLRPREPPPPPPASIKKHTSSSAAPAGRGRDFPGSQRSAPEKKPESSKSKASESSATYGSYTKSQPKIANNTMTVEPPVRNRLSSTGSSSNVSAAASNQKKISQKESTSSSAQSVPQQANTPPDNPPQTQQQRALNALTQQLLQTFSQQNKKPLKSTGSQMEIPSTELMISTGMQQNNGPSAITSTKSLSDPANSPSNEAAPATTRRTYSETSSQSSNKHLTNTAPVTPQKEDDSDPQHSIEIVTKENSVSEIRIYSTPSIITTSEDPRSIIKSDTSSDVTVQEMHYAATELVPPQHQHHHTHSGIASDNRSETIHYRQSSAPSAITFPQSTSVVLIIDSVSGEQNYSTLPIPPETDSASYNHNDISAPAAAQCPPIQKNIPHVSLPHPRDSSSTSVTDPLQVFSLDSDSISSRKRAVSNEYVSNNYIKSKYQTSEPLYDDVINHNSSKDAQRSSQNEPPRVPPPPVPPHPPPASNPPTPSENTNQEPIYSDASNRITDNFDIVSTYHSNYSSRLNNKDHIIYDDTLSLISSTYGSNVNGRVSTKITDILTELDEDGEEPLYDDVINLLVPDSDSGAETEEPPPLPASGPPVHLLSKVSTELPVLNFPLLTAIDKDSFKSGRKELSNSHQYNEDGNRLPSETNKSNIIRSLEIRRDASNSSFKETSPQSHVDGPGSSPLPPSKEETELVASNNNSGNDAEEDILDRTRTLLMELNDKLTKLNFPSNNDYSTYVSKVIISSSSESSGVEEDYNSEKNYSLSNVGSRFSQEHYRMNAISKLASETISMARGKFLDSMKMSISNTSTELPVGAAHNRVHHLHSQSLNDLDEPIYEEIRDINRSSSPIYADAFDSKSLFESASRNEILSFLESIRDRLTVTKTSSIESGSSSVHSTIKPRKQVDIERNDSGIGSESGSLAPALTPPSVFVAAPCSDDNTRNSMHLLCIDCNSPLPADSAPSSDSTILSNAGATIQGTCSSENLNSSSPDQPQLTIMGHSVRSSLCKPCSRKRSERKEILQEIYETELKYGRDLKIIEDEFYNPIQTGGLLSKEQLDQIFLNVDQLIQINQQLTSTLQTSIDSSLTSQDDDLVTVNVGKIFMEYGEVMMSAFESYCTRQANAGALLAQLEKEKELLRIFLRVSQMENTVLRRMNLPAFLMVPVQRVTRYPLLLARLLKVTPPHHTSRDELYLAQEKIELHLEHMNKTTRDVGSVKLWRRISSINGSSSPVHRRSSSDLDGANVRIRKMALDVLDWANFTDVTSVIESQLSMVHFNGKNLRNIYACLLARGKQLESLACKMEQPVFFPPSEDIVKDAKLVLVRVKNTRFCLLREPLCLSKCVVSQGENEFQDFIEINEIITKNTYYFQAMDKQGTADWLRLLQCHALCVGQWRRRRGALANIMMNGMIRHL